MKSTKLLAALAGTALLAACSQEDVFTVNNTPQQMEEVVGAKLAGTDISLNATKGGGQTRMTIQGNWEETDVLGLGWIVNGNPYDVQSDSMLPTSSRLYANHMFSYDKTVGEFTSKGNIYEGWYFAYYPWKYEKNVAPKVLVVNPAQTGKEVADRMSQGLHISNLKYISADDLDANNALESSFKMYGAVSYLQVRTTPDGEFKKDGKLDINNTIQTVTINAGVGNNIFADSLKLRAAAIPVYDAEKTDSANMAGIMDFTKVLFPVDGNGTASSRKSEIVTNVEAAGFKVSDEKTRLITIVIPTTADLDSTNLTIEVAIAGGKFVIKNVDGAAEGGNAAKNNAALGVLADAYKAGGKLTTTGNAQTINVVLYGDIFVTDFNSISNIEEWKAAVDLVDALGRTNETFKIDSTIVFTDSIYMPEICKLTVLRKSSDKDALESFKLEGNHKSVWPANLNSIDIRTNVAKNAVVDNAHTIVARQILNEGTMNVPAGGTADARYTVGRDGYTTWNNGVINLNGMYSEVVYTDNRGGRINLVYGGFVGLSDPTYAGEIAYVVKDEDVANPKRIQNVINTENAKGEALVNILSIYADNLTNDSINFTKTTGATGSDADPYNPTQGSSESSELLLQNLEKVSLDIDGVKVCSTLPATVKSVTMKGANASLTNIKVKGNLTVSGKGAVECTTIGGDVVTDGNLTATTVEGSIDVKSNVVKVSNINGGIAAAVGSVINATTIDGNVMAQNCQVNATTINGNVDINASDLTAATIDGNVTAKNGSNIYSANITGAVNIPAGIVNMDDINIAGALENKGTATITGDAAAIGSIINYKELTSSTTLTVATIHANDKSVTTVADNDTIWYTTANGYTTGKGATRTGAIEYKDAATVLADFKAAVAAGGEVTLAADVTLTESMTVTKNATVDLNGKNITLSTATADEYKEAYAFVMNDANATLVINGAGKVYSNAEEAYYNIPVVAWAGTVEINGGHFISGEDADGNTSHAVYAAGDAKVIINDGKFECQGERSGSMNQIAVLNCYDGSNAKITVNGGQFKNFVPGFETTEPAGNEKEVVLGEGKNVYDSNGNEVTAAHTGTDMWYIVK